MPGHALNKGDVVEMLIKSGRRLTQLTSDMKKRGDFSWTGLQD
jgi:hypothetical protein